MLLADLIGWVLVSLPVGVAAYTFVGYPLLLRVLPSRRPQTGHVDDAALPSVTITVPVFNEERNIRRVLDGLLAQDYPRALLDILVISDASTDRTDAYVREYAERGVRLLRLPVRSGKTAAENAAHAHLRGDVIVNVDATVRLAPGALRHLVAVFADPTIGVASGRDLSVGAGQEATAGESGYVGLEMRLRDLETAAGSIVGASGCFFAVRRALHPSTFPEALSRDFATPLLAREAGYRSVSVPAAVCSVPRTGSLASEYRRKVRTMARGLETLWFLRRLMHPIRYGRFAFMLISHKLLRWLLIPLLPVGLVGLALLAIHSLAARVALGAVLLGGVAGFLAMRWPRDRLHALPRPLALVGFVVGTVVAGIAAWLRAVRGRSTAIWEPTRRGPAA